MSSIKKIIFLLSFSLIASPLFSLSFKSSPGLEYLEQTSKAFTEIGKKASSSSVFIKARQKTQNRFQGYNYPPRNFDPFDDSPLEEFFDHFPRFPFFGQYNSVPFSKHFNPFFTLPLSIAFPLTEKLQAEETVGGGSGLVVSEDGYILTNYHVIKDADSIAVLFNNGKEYKAKVVGTDHRTDLAVLKIEKKGLSYLKFADSSQLEKGEWVIAIGNPFGLESSLTVGVVSAIGRQDLGIAALEDYIQTDAAINPGNSGGPLLNLNGNVIGINTAKVRGGMGIGFAIPSNLAKRIFDQIVETGTVKRVYLGVILQEVDPELAHAMDLEETSGVLIAEVVPNSPAEKGGLKQGDIVLALDGQPVKSMTKLRNQISLMEPDAKITLKILRGKKSLNLPIQLGTLTESEVASAELSEKLGMTVENLQDLPSDVLHKLGPLAKQEGVIITKVRPGSPSALSGLRPYFLITSVVTQDNEHKKITNTKDFNDALKGLGDKKYLVVIVRHQNYQKYYTIKLQD